VLAEDPSDARRCHGVDRERLEAFYNPVRRHSHPGYVNPMEFELKRQVAMMAA
jgi:hypothetical protein